MTDRRQESLFAGVEPIPIDREEEPTCSPPHHFLRRGETRFVPTLKGDDDE